MKDALYHGFNISKDEYTSFIGGKSTCQKIVKNLENILMKEIKKTSEIVFKKFEYADTARISWSKRPGEIIISYSIWAVDSTDHMMSATYKILFTGGKKIFEITSGWDG